MNKQRSSTDSNHHPRLRHRLRSENLPVGTKLSQRYEDIPQLTLNVDKSKITDLCVEEGSPLFAFWFVVFTYLPILTACLCPMANMVSIAGLVTNWRSDPDTGKFVKDDPTILILNSLSLAMGAMGNISIILNFGRRVGYKVCQVVSILGFFSASTFLLIAVILANHRYFVAESYGKTEGLWFAVITIVLYSGCCGLCMLNFSGYLMGKYPPDFNLSKAERGLIIYTFLLAVWFVWGAAVFSKLLNQSYGNALYYCIVSLLTIGLGDIIPRTNGARALSLIYSLTGVIILALIIAMIRSMVSSKARPVLWWNEVEINRKQVLKKIQDEGLKVSQEDSFDLMRSIRRQARISQNRHHSLMTIVIFICFWLIGALIFHLTENDWTYFDAVYFCFLCLLTIGYGDFAPKSSAGRPVFIIWALGAVPLMTALISSVGDTVYSIAMSGTSIKIIKKIFNRNRPGETPDVEAYTQDRSEEDLDMDEQRTVGEIMYGVSRREKNVYTRKQVLQGMKKLLVESQDFPFKRYGYDQWNTVVQLLELEDEEVDAMGLNNNLFWLSDESPLRFPISEPNYLLFLLFSKMESLVTEEIERLEDEKANKPDGNTSKDYYGDNSTFKRSPGTQEQFGSV